MKIFFVLISIFTSMVQADVTVRIGLDGVVLTGKQRGNLFHMLGCYTQILTKQTYHYPRENLQKNMREYESVISQMNVAFPDMDIQTILQHSQKTWEKVKPELLSSKDPEKKLDVMTVRMLINHISSLSHDMQNIQERLREQYIQHVANAAIEASSNLLEASARLSAYYLINTSLLGVLVDGNVVTQSMNMYKKSLNTLEYSVFSQANIFKKRFKEFKKVHFFNIMKIQFSKTAVPSLMIKKNNQAYLHALISLKLMTTSSVEGVEKTNKMMY